MPDSEVLGASAEGMQLYSMGFGGWPEWKSSGNLAFRTIPILQEFTFCGLTKEDCVTNQTLRCKSCWVPCTGLYADVADDSSKQATQALELNVQAFKKDVVEGKVLIILPFDPCKSGLHTLTEELNSYAWKQSVSKERVLVALQQMFPTSADEKVDNIKSLTESYHRYKREYVKHLNFNPQAETLSKCFLIEQQ